jgi:hypothetical protein
MLTHSERINKTYLKIADIRTLSEYNKAKVFFFLNLLFKRKIKLNERLSLIAKVLIQIFRFEKRQLHSNTNNPIPVWTGQSKMSRATYLVFFFKYKLFLFLI